MHDTGRQPQGAIPVEWPGTAGGAVAMIERLVLYPYGVLLAASLLLERPLALAVGP